MRISIKLKSSLFLAVLLIATVSVLSFLVLDGIRKNQRHYLEELLAQKSKSANLFVQQEYFTGEFTDPGRFLSFAGQALAINIEQISGLPVNIYELNGKKVGSSLPGEVQTDVKGALEIAAKGKVAYLEIDDALYYLAPLRIGSKQVAVIQFDFSLKSQHQFYQDIQQLFLFIGSITFIISFLGGFLFFRRLTGRILKLKIAVEQIRAGTYRGFPRVQSSDELGELSRGIAYMAGRIEDNISAMQSEQAKLQLAIERLQKLEQQQKEFIGNISHEFKTPLTAIKAYIDLLEMYKDDALLSNEAIRTIGKENERLAKMVEKTLHLANLERYDFYLHKEEVEVKALLEDICSRLKGKMHKFGLELTTALEEAVIWADRQSLIQVFMNLLDNAVQYTDINGRIIVRSYINRDAVSIEVSDSGIGIPAEARQRIYEPFFTVNKDRSRQYGGVGLGLALVKKLVELQDGQITLEDNTGSGTTFIVSFKLRMKSLHP